MLISEVVAAAKVFWNWSTWLLCQLSRWGVILTYSVHMGFIFCSFCHKRMLKAKKNLDLTFWVFIVEHIGAVCSTSPYLILFHLHAGSFVCFLTSKETKLAIIPQT